MYNLIKMIITMVAIVSLICCPMVVSATEDTTEATEPSTDLESPKPATDNDAVCCLMLAIGVPSGCIMAQGFSFWKW